MSTWETVLAYIVGPTVVAIFTYAASRAAARSSEHAAARSAQVQEESVQITGFHQLVTDLQAAREVDREDIDRLRRDVDADRQALSQAQRELTEIRAQRKRDKDLIRRLVQRLRAAIAEIQRLGGTVPPDADRDMDRITLILNDD